MFRKSLSQTAQYKMSKESCASISNKLVPHNSLSDMLKGKPYEVQQIDCLEKDCDKCYEFMKNVDHLESYLRNSILQVPCSSCSTCLSFLQFMKQTMQQQEHFQRKHESLVNTPILTQYSVIEEQLRYMNECQPERWPECETRPILKKVASTPRRRVSLRESAPRVVELPTAGMGAGRVYNTRAQIRRQAAVNLAAEKKPNANGKVTIVRSNLPGTPSPNKKLRKKRARAVKANDTPRTKKTKKLETAKP